MTKKNLKEFEQKIGVSFKNIKFLEQAFVVAQHLFKDGQLNKAGGHDKMRTFIYLKNDWQWKTLKKREV